MSDFVLPNSSNLAFIEAMYLEYLRDPNAVDAQWRSYFAETEADMAPALTRLGPSFEPFSLFNPPAAALPGGSVNGNSVNGNAVASLEPPERDSTAEDIQFGAGEASAMLQHRVEKLIRNYRVRGHRLADVDPLGSSKPNIPELNPTYYGLTEANMRTKVYGGSEAGQHLADVLERLRNTYCRSIGVQFMHIDDIERRQWLQERMEKSENRLVLSRALQLRILTKLTDAVIFEEFLQKKYVGAKSFSLEGGETLIPLLDLAIEKAGEHGIREVVLGMAHRGRLNVLANIMGKNPRDIFREFDDVDPEMHRGSGDVKYHLGYSSDWTTLSGSTVHLSLCFNPSHLEFVNTVVLGRVRAKQDRFHDDKHSQGLAILIHGDASFAGEGVVQETLNMSELTGYNVGGALHIIVNNQIGFTTSPQEGRSSTYASDVAKLLQSPIFHVNGEDPEAAAQAMQLAMDFRRTFKCDVVIDMYCYRRFGHNEGDEPSFTQPKLYESIRKRQGVREAYLERLLTLGEVSQDEATKLAEERRERLEQELSAARSENFKPQYQAYEGVWKGYRGGADSSAPEVDTGVATERLAHLLERQAELPEGFNLNRKLQRFVEGRRQMAQGKRELDWSAAESLAFATLVTEGHRVRMSGQDSERGTFSHRHAMFHDTENGQHYMPLQHLDAGQAPMEIYNSPLSEAGVLGFEYGYSLDLPDGLTVWEAQFGDFVNAGQVIIDQFIASGEDKWRRLSALVMLLPHGFEGQGPEHSSARLERFLTLAAQDNMQIANPTTPAQMFHLLRRQVVRPWRKPLIVMTPKSLLRHPKVASSLEELSQGTFQRILPDADVAPKGVKRLLLCSGKVYYDLEERRRQDGREDIAILRFEQLYPLSAPVIEQALAPYAPDVEIFWVQEEPRNMGAWSFMHEHLPDLLRRDSRLIPVTRPASASPATGSRSSHNIEQAELIEAAFASCLR